MSRSRRRNPIWGIAICRSERWDKKDWHGRFRPRERQALVAASPEALESHLPVLERQVSNVWAMGKDGRAYHPLKDQIDSAAWAAQRKGRNASPHERAALKKRLLYKSMRK
ncbi:hypothetical protein [Massilia pseudoviolaceinigra]|uniref:hypothetical protein n=1 Tax=Massilia pseudoviolaceinigra TaxID=3057165 RepID=UPI0027964061|nr:hypothetical protein [Massilia sp. CCM 9206]MDQ1919809.1 hypothetical protein [Massilia sp. CCM 9206]